jgi:hypothetical protein
MILSLTFFPLCAVVAFVCTAVKDTDRNRILNSSARLFGTVSSGIVGFALAVHLITTFLV